MFKLEIKRVVILVSEISNPLLRDYLGQNGY